MPGKPHKRHPVTQPLNKTYRLIPLTQGQNAIVDLEDFEWLSQWNWFAQYDPTVDSFYVVRNGPRAEGKKRIFMARIILGCAPEEEGDHKNHNTLDNRRENLRKSTISQNKWNLKPGRRNNSSGFHGVSWHARRDKWMAGIRLNGKGIKLGYFR